MAKINEIDITSLTLQEGAAPSTPASTKWKIYAKTDGLYQIDDAGSETSLAGGGGGASVSRVGRTTAGASWLSPTNKTARKLALTAGDVVLSLGMYARMSAANVSGLLQVALFTDDSTGVSQPGNLLSIATSTPVSDEFLFQANDERWFYVPLGAYIPSTGDYWIAFWIQDTNDFQIAYDTTGGTAALLSAGGVWWTDFAASGHGFTAQTWDLSLHAVVLG